MMKTKTFWFALLTVLAILATTNSVSALATSVSTTVNGIDVVTQPVSIFAGETIPLRVSFTANANATDVRVKAWISGYRSDISASSERFDIINGSRYTSKLLTLTAPSDIDPSENVLLVIRVETKDAFDEARYNLNIQRDSYDVEVMSVEVQILNDITPGSNAAIDVVLKNRGMRKLDDTYIKVKIPQLNVETKVYAGDLLPQDNDDDTDKDDAVEKRIFVKIPSDAAVGTYSMTIEAYNKDVSQTATQNIEIGESADKSDVLVPVADKSIAVGEEATYELIIVNSGDRIKSYTISPESASSLTISVEEPVVAVSADSSRTVNIRVKANEKGTYAFALNVKSGDELIKRATFSASVSGTAVNTTLIWTIVLAIVFVVLLIALIVLLTKKPAKKEEFSESYY